MINAQAIVDTIRASDIGLSIYEVTVTGAAPHDFVRIYQIQSKTEHDAAFEGIRRFDADMSNQQEIN